MRKHLVFSTLSELICIMPDNLVCISADGNYCTLLQADGTMRTVTIQLGQIESLIFDQQVESDGSKFVRIGKSLIINIRYVYYVNPTRQKLILSDARSFTHDMSASKEALKQLKEYIEKEVKK